MLDHEITIKETGLYIKYDNDMQLRICDKHVYVTYNNWETVSMLV